MQTLLNRLEGVRETGKNKWKARCPAHDDRIQSLSLRQERGVPLIWDFAGCSTEEVLRSVGLGWGDLLDGASETGGGHVLQFEPLRRRVEGPAAADYEARYIYTDSAGAYLYEKRRYPGKRFVVGREREGGFLPGREGPAVPYRLSQLLSSPKDALVFYVEGEKDADRLASLGLVAVTAGGASEWRDEYAQYFKGRSVVVIPDADAPGLLLSEKVSEALEREGCRVGVLSLGGSGGADASDWLDTAGGTKERLEQLSADLLGRSSPKVASSVAESRVQWLWDGWIALGKLNLIEGDPGTGKSTLSVALAAGLSRKGVDSGELGDGPRSSLIISCEDSLSDTITPRLKAAGADLGKVFVWTEGLDLSKEIHKVEKWTKEIGARLVVIDPLMAYLGSEVDSNKDQSVRRVLARLGRMAEDTGAAVVLIRHLNKDETKSSIYRGGGSIGIIGAARSALRLVRDADEPQIVWCVSIKNNLSRPPEKAMLITRETPQGVPYLEGL